MQQSILLAKYTYTPVTYWLELSVGEFFKWIGAVNDLIKNQKR